MKKRKRTATELARAWREEKVDFHEALICHLVDNLGLRPDEAFILDVSMAISYVNMGQGAEIIDLPGNQQMTAEDVVAELGLEPFLEHTK